MSNNNVAGGNHVDSKKARPKDVCGHCELKCTAKGKGDDGICCDYCGYWVHATCDGMSKETFKSFNKLAKDIPNMSYYCTYNHCKYVAGEILKQLGPIRQKVEENSQRITKLEEAVGRQNVDMEEIIQSKVEDTIDESIRDRPRVEEI